jgi:DNA repair photolyase
VKRNIPNILAKELNKKTPGVVGLSTVTDPYQPIEKTYQLSRYCLQQLLKKNFPVSIQTKSSLILRDFDIINQFSQIEVMMSIATDNEFQRKFLEPESSSISERIKVLKSFGETSVKTSVFLGPIYPTVSVDSLPKFLDSIIDANVNEIMIDIFHIKPGLQHSIASCLKDRFELLPYFSLNKLIDRKWFSKIRYFIQDYLKHTDINVVDAF